YDAPVACRCKLALAPARAIRPSKVTSGGSTLCPGWLCLHSKKSPSRRGKPPDARVGNSAFARTHHRLSASTVHSRSILQKAVRSPEGGQCSLVLRVPGSSPGAPTIDPAVLFACIRTSQSSLIFGLKNLLARSHLRRSSFAIAVSPRAGSRAALLAGETTTMRHRRKPIKAHTSHRQGEANTLATAPAISL